MTATYTQAYIIGIKEGRSFLDNNPDLTTTEKRECLDTAKRLMKQYSGCMKDCFKGERDFWKLQIKMKS